MRRIQSFYRLFRSEPLGFRVLVIGSLLVSIVLSSSFVALGGYSESISKLAAAVLFGAFGVSMRRTRNISLLLFALAALCLYLAWVALP